MTSRALPAAIVLAAVFLGVCGLVAFDKPIPALLASLAGLIVQSLLPPLVQSSEASRSSSTSTVIVAPPAAPKDPIA